MDVRIQSIHFDASEQLQAFIQKKVCLLYTSDAADEL